MAFRSESLQHNLTVQKVRTTQNPAGIFTKEASRETLERQRKMLGLRHVEARGSLSLAANPVRAQECAICQDSGSAEIVGSNGVRMVMVMSIPLTSRSSFLWSDTIDNLKAKSRTNEQQFVFAENQLDFVKLQHSSFESAQQRFNVVVACILVQRRKAAIQEGVKKFHLCLCLVSIVQMHSLLFVLLSASGTCGTPVLFAWLFHQSIFVSIAVLVWSVLSHEHNAYALAQAIRVQRSTLDVSPHYCQPVK